MKFILIILLAYIGFVVILFTKQRDFIYSPDTSKPAPVQGAEIINIITKDGQALEAWYFLPKSPDKKTIVFFHGNAGNYGDILYKAQYYLDAGYGALLAEYRGYGGNSGKPSEQGFYDDGRAYINWLVSDKNIKYEQIILYGESIGSGTAVQMATEYNIGGLILEVPFSSLLDVASKQYFYVPVRYLLKDRYMNIEKIKNINASLLIMHGHNDQMIPFYLAKKLFEEAVEPKKFIEYPQGEHNNLYDFGASKHVLAFLAGLNVKKHE